MYSFENLFEKISVKILTKPTITQEMINASEKPVMISFDSLEPSIYKDFRNIIHVNWKLLNFLVMLIFLNIVVKLNKLIITCYVF